MANIILVAVDFSPCSVAALRRAAGMAALRGADLVAMHVIAPPMPVHPLLGADAPPPGGDQADPIQAAQRECQRFLMEHAPGANARVLVTVGHPRDELLGAVQRLTPELLVIGAHSPREAFRGVGTTAAACAQRAAAPVLVVRDGPSEPFQSVLACVDFGETSREVLEQAIAAAAGSNATLHVLTVYGAPLSGKVPPEHRSSKTPGGEGGLPHAARERLRQYCEPFVRKSKVSTRVYHAVQGAGHAEAIMAFAASQGCDLVVLGTRARFNLRDYFWGSTAERVVREAPCSVLAIKPPGYTAPETYQALADAEAVVHPVNGLHAAPSTGRT